VRGALLISGRCSRSAQASSIVTLNIVSGRFALPSRRIECVFDCARQHSKASPWVAKRLARVLSGVNV
jgi:hypothetical protein